MRTDTLSKISSAMKDMEGSHDFFQLFSMLDSGRVSLYRKDDPKDLEEWTRKLVSLLSRIVTIVYDPSIVTTKEESVKRVEVAGPLSPEDFRRTVREPSFWQDDEKAMVPQLVHASEKIDTADTYENRFLCMLIVRLQREFDTLRHLFGRRSESLLDLCPTRRLDYAPTGLLSRFSSFDVPYVDEREKVVASEGVEGLLKKGDHLLRRLLASSFYHDLSAYPIRGEIQPTNILLHHPLYGYCYRFYVQELRNGDNPRQKTEGFRSFVLLSLLSLLREEGFQWTPYDFNIEEGRIAFRCLYARKKTIALSVYPKKDGLLLRSTFLDPLNGAVRMKAERLLLLRPSADEEDEKDLLSALRSGAYDDVSMASLLLPKEEKDLDHVLVLVPGLCRSRESLRNYLHSLFLLIREKGGFDYRCPVCGNGRLSKADGGYYCPGCHSRLVLCKDRADDILWITGLWRSR